MSYKDDEWNREYNRQSDRESSENEERKGDKLEGEEEVKDGDRVGQIQANLTLQAAMIRGDTVVKHEVDLSLATKDTKTYEMLLGDPKKALKNLGGIIADTKELHADTKAAEFTGDIHQAITVLLPKLAKEFRRVENIALKTISDPVEIKKSAESLDVLYADFNKAEEAGNKFFGKKKKRKLG